MKMILSIIHFFLLFLFLWQSLFRISDKAISLLLSFMANFFLLASTCLHSLALVELSPILCIVLRRLQENFTRYVSCPSCHKLYPFDNCWRPSEKGKQSNLCSFRQYPNHLQLRMRVACGQKLLKTVRSSSGTEYLAPYQTYCFKSVIESLEELLNRPNYTNLCESWRSKKKGVW